MRPEKPWERARRGGQAEANHRETNESGSPVPSTSLPAVEPVARASEEANASVHATGAYGGYGGGYGSGYGGQGGGYMGYNTYAGYGGSYGGGYGGGYGSYGGYGLGQGSGYGGYLSGGYGGMYGTGYGGMYGRGAYGSGGWGYGNGYGYGSMPGMPPGPNGPSQENPVAPHGPSGIYHSAMRTLQSVVGFFGRISYLVDQNTIALHMFIEALLNLLDRAGWLYGEMARFVLRILGYKPKEHKKLEENGQSSQSPVTGPSATTPNSAQGGWEQAWRSPSQSQ